MKRTIRNTSGILLCFFLLLGIIGVPVIFNHTHHQTALESPYSENNICQPETTCCQNIADAQPTQTKSNCQCELFTTCCCFLDFRIVSFTFETTTYHSLVSPSFIQAYQRDLGHAQMSLLCWRSLLNLALAHIKINSQKLPLIQVLRF